MYLNKKGEMTMRLASSTRLGEGDWKFRILEFRERVRVLKNFMPGFLRFFKIKRLFRFFFGTSENKDCLDV